MNLPTKITIARIALIPLFILFYILQSIWQYSFIPMTLIYILASCTDFIDGHLARSRNLVTDLGKFLDPIADKTLVVAGLFILVDMYGNGNGAVSANTFVSYFILVGSIVIMARELIISAFRQIAATKNFVMAADKLGKAKTVITLIAIPALFFGLFKTISPIAILGDIFYYFGLVCFAAAIVLTIWSGINYMVKNKDVLKDVENDAGGGDELK